MTHNQNITFTGLILDLSHIYSQDGATASTITGLQSNNVLHYRALLQKVHYRCSTSLLLPVGTILRYNLLKTIIWLNLMKQYVFQIDGEKCAFG